MPSTFLRSTGNDSSLVGISRVSHPASTRCRMSKANVEPGRFVCSFQSRLPYLSAILASQHRGRPSRRKVGSVPGATCVDFSGSKKWVGGTVWILLKDNGSHDAIMGLHFRNRHHEWSDDIVLTLDCSSLNCVWMIPCQGTERVVHCGTLCHC
nr:hypothetical protein CFP56_03949 [Quercus suber]